jgi:hypothetical protein
MSTSEASNRPDDLIRLLIPFGGWNESDVPRITTAVVDAYREEFGDEPTVTSRQVEIGRGGDAGATLVEIAIAVGSGVALFVAPAEITKAIAVYREWGRRLRSFVERLRAKETAPIALSANVATMIAIGDLDERAGPVTRLVWWDEIVVQPFEWVADASAFEATAERLYSYVFETERSRWYIVTKADGTVVTEAETMMPRDHVEYAFWRRHDEMDGG